MSFWKKLYRFFKFGPPKYQGSPPSEHTCIHEAGHYMVAWLFPETLQISELNVNKLSLPDKWNGGLAMTNQATKITAAVIDKFLLTACGGMVANTIQTYGQAYVENHIAQFPYQHKLLDAEGGTDDYEMMKTYADDLASSNGLDRARVIWNAFQTIFIYMMQPAIWQAVTVIAKAASEHRELRMSNKEIGRLLRRKVGRKKLEEARAAFLTNRYPLSKNKITTLMK
jgi:hypothetical protein